MTVRGGWGRWVLAGVMALGLTVGCEADDGPPLISDVWSALPALAEGEGFRLDQGTFTAGGGEEILYCMRLPIPEAFAGRDLVLMGWDSDVPPLTHHYFMAYNPEPLDSDVPVPCDGVDPILYVQGMGGIGEDQEEKGGGKLLFGAGEGISTQGAQNPDYGKFIPAGGHFVTSHHVLNFTPEPAEMYARFNLRVQDAATIPHPTNQLNCLSMDIEVPPQSQVEVTATCVAPFDLDLITLASHGHQHLTRFESRLYDGEETLPEVIYESTDWDSPHIIHLAEPIHLKAGEGITFTCHYDNWKDVPVVYGAGVDNEMCASMNAYAYPDGQAYEVPPPLGTLILDNDKPMPLIDTSELDTKF